MSSNGFYSTPEHARLAAAQALSVDAEREDASTQAAAATPNVGKRDVEAARRELQSFFEGIDV